MSAAIPGGNRFVCDALTAICACVRFSVSSMTLALAASCVNRSIPVPVNTSRVSTFQVTGISTGWIPAKESLTIRSVSLIFRDSCR